MSDWQNYPVEKAPERGSVIDSPYKTPNLADEAEMDKRAGEPTVGTRGYVDTDAFEKRNGR